MMCAGPWTPQKTLTTGAIIEKLRAGASQGFDEVIFSGGEPTIRGDICEIVAAARDLRYPSIVLQTNARRLSDADLTKRLLSTGVTRFLVSLHGADAAVHDGLTHVPGSFDEALRGIRNVQEFAARDTRVAVHSVVLPSNYRSLSAIVDLVFALGIPMLKLSYVVPVGKGSGVYDEHPMPSLSEALPHMQQAVDRFVALYGSTPMTSISIGYVPLCLLEGYERFSDEVSAPPTFFMDDDMQLELADAKIAAQGLKVKRKACKTCRHTKICSGVWREYVTHFGWDEFQPAVA
jgi:MoaA/NifB/PqqE/SkfB family radical SAM enzyme